MNGKKLAAVVPADEQTLAELGLADGGVLNVKDLGKQISWRAVYLIEYVRSLVVVDDICRPLTGPPVNSVNSLVPSRSTCGFITAIRVMSSSRRA